MRINYNVTGSKRKELVQAVADFLAVHPVYLGAPTFAYKVGGCQVDVHGVLTTPDTCDEVAAALLDALKQRGFEPFHDEEPASTVETAPTGTEDYSYIVEIPKNGVTPEAEDNLAKIIASKATLLKKALGTDTLEVIQTETTLKFPWFTLHNLDEEADAYNRLITAICKMAKEQRRVTAVERPTDNEKFTMRIFLIRLGFVGDDYKKARKILLRNLSGNSSWKSGHRPERAEATTSEPNISETEILTTETIPADNSVEELAEHPDSTLTDGSADEKGSAPYEQ